MADHQPPKTDLGSVYGLGLSSSDASAFDFEDHIAGLTRPNSVKVAAPTPVVRKAPKAAKQKPPAAPDSGWVEFARAEKVKVPNEDYRLVRRADLRRIKRRLARLRDSAERWRSAAWGMAGISVSIACTGLAASRGALLTSPALWSVAGACGVLAVSFGLMQRTLASERDATVEELSREVDEVLSGSQVKR